MELKTVSVVYLCYLPYGFSPVFNFIESYKKHYPGLNHELIIIFKGEMDKDLYFKINQFLYNNQFTYFEMFYSGPGFDIAAYRYAASFITSDYVLFFNSNSVIQADNWLHKYFKQVANGALVVAATVSKQSHYTSVFLHHKWQWEANKPFSFHFRKYKLFLKNIFWWRLLFPPAPNYHFRTNAFLIDRELFLSLKIPAIKNKFIAYQVESGYRGITRQLLKRKIKMMLVDKHGIGYVISQWHIPNVFFKGEQEDLLIADNQTNIYSAADPEEKKRLHFLNQWHY